VGVRKGNGVLWLEGGGQENTTECNQEQQDKERAISLEMPAIPSDFVAHLLACGPKWATREA
jgi:hypothetical protein